ncbi:MAG: hypothetical protein ACREHG_04665, partial [Candidatus Saccharimonadales bacterium]
LQHGDFRVRKRPVQSIPTRTGLPPSRRFVIHVGLPKTGTKYIQHFFTRVADAMRVEGIDYPTDGWKPDDIFGHHELNEELNTVPNQRLQSAFRKMRSSGYSTILLSCEGFSALNVSSLEYLLSLVGTAGVDIVFYCRRWSDWIPSIWQQSIRQGGSLGFPEHYANVLTMADSHPGINYAIFFDKFAKVFGSDCLNLISYSNLSDNSVDILEPFLDDILHWIPEIQILPERIHESMGILTSEIVRNINWMSHQKGLKIGDDVYRMLQRCCDLNECFSDIIADSEKILGEYVVSMEIDDQAPGLRDIYSQLNENFGTYLLRSELGQGIFSPRKRSVQYVSQNCLLDGKLAANLNRIFDTVCSVLPLL